MSFIWLPNELYPKNQGTFYNPLGENKPNGNYTVCRVSKKYSFDSMVSCLEITFSADTACLIKINGEIIARGPAYSGGDFLNNDKPRSDYYSLSLKYVPNTSEVEIESIVRMMPYHLSDYSRGQGGFYLSGRAYLENGKITEIKSDDSWDIELLKSYTSPRFFDNTVKKEPRLRAEIKEDIWKPQCAPIPPCTLERLSSHTFLVEGGKSLKKTIEYDKIHACYLTLRAKVYGKAKISIYSFEADERTYAFGGIIEGQDTYYGLELNSLGGYDIEIANEGEGNAEIEVIFDSSFFPIDTCAKSTVSDGELNDLMAVCRHTLKYCRQLHHLDSPKHSEPLACVGDYYIEMLMTQFSYGDFRLCRFDLERIARTMVDADGRLFHTTYSLIWVNMIYEYYMITGDKSLLEACKAALDLLLKRFDGYIGENGLIETPPDYMFVDWLFPDNISTHHPPKALGQGCLNMFYFGALNSAEKIYTILGFSEMAKVQGIKANALKKSILTYLYDKEKGLFFEGLNTKTPDNMLWQYLPQNVEKRYYRRHTNILGCYFGIFDKSKCQELLETIYNDSSLGEVQPYFMHFWLDAIYRNGLSKKYTLPLLELWKKSIKECPKGLVEGFYLPEPTYKFDHSHAWGGTPLYSLPMALCGLEILEPGYKKIKLKPQLLDLDFAKIEIPTPYGIILVDINKNGAKITAPSEITIVD
ncbi:MAG: hypothetical protein J6A96_01850 [Clostridia bacterium]|nr:hypothetical protein [Clostridia bacterium]